MGTKRRRHSPDQIIRTLAEGQRLLAGGQGLDEVCRRLDGRGVNVTSVARPVQVITPTGRKT